MPGAHQPRDLADGQAVADRDRAQPHERLGVRLDVAALDRRRRRAGSAGRAPPPATPARAGRLHAPAPWSRRTCSSGCRCPAGRPAARRCPPAPRRGGDSDSKLCAVEAGHRDAGAAVALAVDADHVLRLAAHAVLGPEQPRRAGPRPRSADRRTWTRSGVTLAGWQSTPDPPARGTGPAARRTRTSIPVTTATDCSRSHGRRPARRRRAASRAQSMRTARKTTSSPRGDQLEADHAAAPLLLEAGLGQPQLGHEGRHAEPVGRACPGLAAR